MKRTIFLFFMLISGSTLPLPSSQQGYTNGFSNSELALIGVTSPVGIAGLVYTAVGIYKFFKDSDEALQSKELSDYSKRELAAMSKEKLTKLIAQEDERRERKFEIFKTFLKGALCYSVVGLTCVYAGETLRTDYKLFEASRTASKTA